MDNSTWLKEEERLDDLQRSGLHIIQHPHKFCFGMDAILLSHFVDMKKSSRILDLGTGTGVIPLMLSALWPDTTLEALEIQEESADMARRSIGLNALDKRIHVTTGDIREASSIYGASSFDMVVSNPPYMNDLHGLKNPDLPMAIARHEVLCTLDDVVGQAARVLKPGGSFYMIHRPFRLPEIISTMKSHELEPKRMRLVHPYVDREPNMVLIQGVRGGRPMLKIDPPLIIYEDVHQYTPEILHLYEDE